MSRTRSILVKALPLGAAGRRQGSCMRSCWPRSRSCRYRSRCSTAAWCWPGPMLRAR
ncbi:hypothetical protein LP419_07930 [Massilia sp. H-1]|nr:hypothetical protein LP419_07930 [Massilia sp. H-1]